MLIHRLAIASYAAVLLAILPVAAHAGAVQLTVGATVTCPVNTCTAPGNLSLGQSNSKNFSFTFMDGTDAYSVTGSFANSYFSGTDLTAGINVTYTGASPSATTDTFSFDVLQNFSSTAPGTWNGTYTESIQGALPTGASLSTNLYYDTTQNVGTIGPITGPGSYNQSISNALTGLTGNTLKGDFQFIFTFHAGEASGASASIVETPEPAEAFPAALFLAGGFFWLRSRKRPSLIF